MVTILSVSFTSPTRIEHERTTAPSMCTEQAPHCATPQPYLVPVRPTCSRMTQSSGVSGSTCTSRTRPLMLSFAMNVLPVANASRCSSALERDLLGVRGAIALVGAIVRGAGLGVHVGPRGRLEVEVAVRVRAAHEHGGRLVLHAQVLHRGRHVADGQADAPAVGSVRLRAVQAESVVERELACAQRGVDRRPVVDLADDRLARTVDAAGHDAGPMWPLSAVMAAEQEL